MAQISDEAYVVRGGRNRPEDIARAIGVHPSGIVGISVESRIFADFHNADEQGRLRLNCVGTVQDLARQEITLYEGLPLILYSEELEADGLVQYSATENLWVALIDWNAIRHQEDLASPLEYQLS